MITKLKINIIDDKKLRNLLDLEYQKKTKIKLCNYSILLIEHILSLINLNQSTMKIIKLGIFINKKWQNNLINQNEVRKISFKIHQLAKNEKNEILKISLRAIGHAIASAHMSEHSMVASDYMIKLINLKFKGNINSIKKERMWQIKTLKSQ